MREYRVGPDEWREKFEACLGKEFSEPGYFEVHHLLVLCYMIQCGAYGEGYRQRAHRLLREFNRGLPPAEVARRAGAVFEKSEGLRLRKEPGGTVDPSRWGLTILDVRTDSAEHYREDVRNWAKDVEDCLERRGE